MLGWIKGFLDASFGDDIVTRRSSSGELIFLNGGPISWFSRLQKLVALSTAESEIYAATDAAKVVAHLKVYFMTCIVMGSQLGNYKKHDTL